MNPPQAPEPEPLDSADLDMAGRLRRRLTRLFRERPDDRPLEPDDWLQSDALPGIAFELAMLSRLETGGGTIRLDDGRRARTSIPVDVPSDLPPDALLPKLVRKGLLARTGGNWVSRVEIELVEHTSSNRS